jgi:hypothetical protein
MIETEKSSSIPGLHIPMEYFLSKKYQFWYCLEGRGMKFFGTFHCHKKIFVSNLVYLYNDHLVFWYNNSNFGTLNYKNLATLIETSRKSRLL